MKQLTFLLLLIFTGAPSYASCYQGYLDSSLLSVEYTKPNPITHSDSIDVIASIDTFHYEGDEYTAKVMGILLIGTNPYIYVELPIEEINGRTVAKFSTKEFEDLSDYNLTAYIDHNWEKPRPARCTVYNVKVNLKSKK